MALWLAAQALATEPEAPRQAPPTVHPILAEHPYYHGKAGFSSITQARDHCYKEFIKGVRQGTLDPSDREYFSYIYTVRMPKGQKSLQFHTPWEPAAFLKVANGCEQYCVQVPFPEEDGLQKTTMLHSHPTRNSSGEGPSRMDIALASTYRKANGRFRYLYLINNRMKLIKYKAVRAGAVWDGSAQLRMPGKPRLGLDWMN